MPETIVKFSTNTNFTGRNGMGTCTAVSVFSRPDKPVSIQPITSKGMIANCEIEIPAADIPALIAALQKAISGVTPAEPTV